MCNLLGSTSIPLLRYTFYTFFSSEEDTNNKRDAYGDGENYADSNDHTNMTRSLLSFGNEVTVFVCKTLQNKGKNNALIRYASIKSKLQHPPIRANPGYLNF